MSLGLDEHEDKENLSTLEKGKLGVKEIIKPIFKKLGLKYSFENSKVGEGINIKIYHRSKDRFISVVPWVRPTSMTIRELTKSLGNYPRLNLTKEARRLPDEEKIDHMLDLCKEQDLYFLVVLPRMFGATLFWLDRYDEIPKKKWNLTYRKNPKDLDRIIIRKNKEPEFKTIEELKKLIINIIKNGSK